MWADNETDFDLLGFDYLVDAIQVSINTIQARTASQ